MPYRAMSSFTALCHKSQSCLDQPQAEPQRKAVVGLSVATGGETPGRQKYKSTCVRYGPNIQNTRNVLA